MIKGVIFDFDMTLVDYNYSDRAALSRVLEVSGLQVGIDEFWEKSGEVIENAFTSNRLAGVNIHEFRLAETLKYFGSRYDDSLLQEYYKIYLNLVPVYDGARDMLDFLKDKVKLGLLTNAIDPFEQKARIQKSNLKDYFNVIGIAYDIGAYKPDIEAFTWMTDKLSLKPQEIVFIGDSEKHDIVGAKNAGFKTIKKIYPSQKPTVADDVFINFSELYAILKEKHAIA